MSKRRKKGSRSLSSGRPPTARPKSSLSRKATRSLINKHHALEKRRLQALKKGHQEEAATITAEILALGGLDMYQQASLVGQSKDRGGDSSKVLMEWLQPLTRQMDECGPKSRRIRMLEVGALSTRNACSTTGYFDVEHIDLNSQEPGILQQDFMERPLPANDGERFDIISLSLVLNFVPDPTDRGSLLRRTLEFLREPVEGVLRSKAAPFPSVFVVIPRSCISNSRYFTEDRFTEVMTCLGFSKTNSKATQKLAYSLWRRDKPTQASQRSVAKKEVNPGISRNNFSIVLKFVAGDSG